jgi:hypothetical protein
MGLTAENSQTQAHEQKAKWLRPTIIVDHHKVRLSLANVVIKMQLSK